MSIDGELPRVSKLCWYQGNSCAIPHVIVVGDITFLDVVAALSPAQETIGREINPTVYPPDEFRAKLLKRNHSIKTILAGENIYLIGDDLEILTRKR